MENENAIQPGMYQHYKGNMYEVLYSRAAHSETGEELVVYRAHYGSGNVWVRPLSMFVETVIIDGNTAPRFKFIEPA